nr:hypothetical protein [Clostridia bacterium]
MEQQKAYLKYKGDFEKTSIFSIVLLAITIAGVLALIFLPIFKITEEFAGITATKEFSMLDELKYNIDGIKSSSQNSSMVGYLMMVFPLLTMVMGAILLIMSVKNLFEEISNRNEDAYMVKYSQIKKSGDEKEKKKFFKQQTLYAFFGYIIFAVVFAKIDSAMFSKSGASISIYSYLMDVNGISVWGILSIFLFVGYVVVHVLKKKKEKEININIIKEEFENNTVSEEKKEGTV